jgi:SAM-dependent methyltransferase
MSWRRDLLNVIRKTFPRFRRHEELSSDGETTKSLSHDDVYDPGYFQFVEQTSARSSAIIAKSIVDTLRPASVVDAGCGTGVLLDQLRSLGVHGRGLEYAEAALRMCLDRQLEVIKFDLTNDQLPPGFGTADVVISLEVGQQLPPAGADRYVGLLCQLADVIIFSSGVPGQGDRRVLNEQPHQYWVDKFRQHGYRFDEVVSYRWREEWMLQDTAPWFYRNVMILRGNHTEQ